MSGIFPSALSSLVACDGAVRFSSTASIKAALIDLDASGPLTGSRIIGTIDFQADPDNPDSTMILTITTGPSTAPVPHGLAVGDHIEIVPASHYELTYEFRGQLNPLSTLTNVPASPYLGLPYTVSSIPDAVTFVMYVSVPYAQLYDPTFGVYRGYPANDSRYVALSPVVLSDEFPEACIGGRSVSLTGIDIEAAPILLNILGMYASYDAPAPVWMSDNPLDFGKINGITSPTTVVDVYYEGIVLYVASPTGGADLLDSQARVISWHNIGKLYAGFPNGFASALDGYWNTTSYSGIASGPALTL